MHSYQLHTYLATVQKVVDGDTVDLNVDLGFEVHSYRRIRLSDINTPELRDQDPIVKEAAYAAKAFVVSQLPVDTKVLLVSTKYDKYGRTLGKIWLLDECGNATVEITAELLRLGHATPYAV